MIKNLYNLVNKQEEKRTILYNDIYHFNRILCQLQAQKQGAEQRLIILNQSIDDIKSKLNQIEKKIG